jgi:hypothetical protein
MKPQEQNQATAQRKFYSKNYNSNTSRKSRKLTDKQLEAIRAKREYLKGLSAPLKELIDLGEIESINEGLKQIYSAQGHKNLKSIRQWNEEGFQVKKGEKALLLWGKPIERKKDDLNNQNQEETTAEENSIFNLFPLCYVFSASQVQEREVTHA